MNVRKFKEIVCDWNNPVENFRLFRIWTDNCYDNYQKCMEIAYDEEQMFFTDQDGFANSEEFSGLNYQWKQVEYSLMTELYNRMGWEVDEKIKQTNSQYDDEAGCLFYCIDFNDIYCRIQDTKDDIEFTYAILMLIKNIYEDKKLYKEFASKIFEGIKECDLEECLELLDDKKTQKVFVAMSFAESMKDARESIEKAVKNCGYVPILIDVKEHNNQIVPEIYREIEGSTFVVADLTGQRGGVYYEAGYAVAKEKPLILSCKRDDEETPHFDVAQINTIFWEDEKDLCDRLMKRINATIKK